VGKDIQHPKGLLLAHKQQQETSQKVQALTITDFRNMKREGNQDSSQLLYDRCLHLLLLDLRKSLGSWGGIGLEFYIVGKGAVKI